MDGGKLLQTSHQSKPLHGPFSSSEGQVRILRPVVDPAAVGFMTGDAEFSQCRTI